jgi:hypothetical protein
MDVRITKGVESIVVIKRADGGRETTRTVYRRKKRRKRGTEPLDSLGRVVRKIVEGGRAAAEKYLDEHDESNRGKKDGWVRDMPYNVYRATSRGLRKVRRTLGLPSVVADED